MPADDDIGLDEKRVYAGTREETLVYVAASSGLVRARVAGGQVGRFELAVREPARDAAGRDGRLLVATDEDALVGTGEGFEPTGFGPAAAVGLAPGGGPDDGPRPLAAAPDGRVAALDGDEWVRLGTVEDPRALDGDLLAAGDGVYRVDVPGASVERLREGPATDVAAAGPCAACPDGLYDLSGGRLRAGEHTAVAADTAGRAHAVSEGELFARENGDGAGDTDSWARCRLPTDEPVVDVAYGDAVYAVTATGTLCVEVGAEGAPDGQGGWRSRALGVRDVVRLAVP